MNDVSLKEYLEALLHEREKRVDNLERSAEKALAKANEAMEKRLDLLNEFRQQSVDEQRKYVERREFIAFQDTWRQGHEQLKEYVDQARGRWVGVPILISGFGLLIGIGAIIVAYTHGVAG